MQMSTILSGHFVHQSLDGGRCDILFSTPLEGVLGPRIGGADADKVPISTSRSVNLAEQFI
jgi:hypothetical protein